MRTLFFVLLAVLSGCLCAQVPGYRGKRAFVITKTPILPFHPAYDELVYEQKIPFKYKLVPTINFSYVYSRKTVLFTEISGSKGFSELYLLVPDENAISQTPVYKKIDFYSDVNILSIKAGTQYMKETSYGDGLVAPIGWYRTVAVSYVRLTPTNPLLESLTTVKPVNRAVIHAGVGVRDVIFSRIVIDLGVEARYPVGLIGRIIYYGNNATAGYPLANKIDFSQNVDRLLLINSIMPTHVGIGFLLF